MRQNLHKLADVAERLGCHVETLRLRIRSGRLKAVRGPHGAYYVSGRSLGHLRVRSHPGLQSPAPTAPDSESAWKTLETRLRQAPRAQEEAVPFLRALKADPTLKRGLYRLAVAYGLHQHGFGVGAVAIATGVTVRHARRLIAKDPAPLITGAAHRWARMEARRMVRELRAQLQAEGIYFHQWTMRGRRRAGPPTRPDRPRPAFKVQGLLPDEKAVLRQAGLSAAQIRAIEIVGLSSDELNYLLLLGSQTGPSH